MRVRVEEGAQGGETEVVIRCGTADEGILRLARRLEQLGRSIPARRGEHTLRVQPGQVYYIESVDGKTFLYLEKEVCETDLRLYALEEMLGDGSFVRVSKSCILNLDHLRGFRSQLYGRLEALLTNGERLDVNRHYVPGLKERLREMEESL